MAKARVFTARDSRDVILGVLVGVLATYVFTYLKQHDALPGVKPNVS